MEELHRMVSHAGLVLAVVLAAAGAYAIVRAAAFRWFAPAGPQNRAKIKGALIWAAVFLLMAIVVFAVRNSVVDWVWG